MMMMIVFNIHFVNHYPQHYYCIVYVEVLKPLFLSSIIVFSAFFLDNVCILTALYENVLWVVRFSKAQ